MSAQPDRLIATLPSEPDAPTSTLRLGTDNLPYLTWSGPDQWISDTQEAFAFPGHPCLPISDDDRAPQSLVLRLPSTDLHPFDTWGWRNLPHHLAVDALLQLTLGIQQLHQRG